MPAVLQHAPPFGECGIDPGDVPQPEGDRAKIGTAVGGRKPFGVGAHPLDPGQNPLVESACASDCEHPLARVEDNNAPGGESSRGSEPGKSPQRDVSSAAGNIEQNLTGVRVQPGG